MNRRTLVAALLACSAAIGWACTGVVGDVVQCKTTEDCEAKGGAFRGSRCVDTVCRGPLACADGTPLPQETATAAVTQRVKFVGIDTFLPIVGATVLVCPQTGNECPTTFLKSYKTDDAGYITADVPSGFKGTFEVHETPPALAGLPPDAGFIKTILYTRRFLTVSDPPNSEPTQATRLLPRIAVDKALADANKPVTDPTKGLLFGAVFDCNQQPLGGARVEMDGVPGGIEPGVTRFYGGSDGFPSPNEQETSAASGIFGLANIDLPTGSRTVKVRVLVRDAAGQEIQWSKFEVVVKRDFLTTVGVRYSP